LEEFPFPFLPGQQVLPRRASLRATSSFFQVRATPFFARILLHPPRPFSKARPAPSLIEFPPPLFFLRYSFCSRHTSYLRLLWTHAEFLPRFENRVSFFFFLRYLFCPGLGRSLLFTSLCENCSLFSPFARSRSTFSSLLVTVSFFSFFLPVLIARPGPQVDTDSDPLSSIGRFSLSSISFPRFPSALVTEPRLFSFTKSSSSSFRTVGMVLSLEVDLERFPLPSPSQSIESPLFFFSLFDVNVYVQDTLFFFSKIVGFFGGI